MTGQEPIITPKLPAECSRHDLDRFRQMVLEAGEVQTARFDNRIARAEILAFLRVGGEIVGVGALKRPGREYSRGIFKNAVAKKLADEFGLELGWVVVEKAHRGIHIRGAMQRHWSPARTAERFLPRLSPRGSPCTRR